MLGCTCLSTSPVSPVLLTATAHNEGCPSAPALRDTSELLENLQKENALVSVMLVQAGYSLCYCTSLVPRPLSGTRLVQHLAFRCMVFVVDLRMKVPGAESKYTS